METEIPLPLGMNEINMFHISALNGHIELFITVFIVALHLSLSSARSIQSTPSHTTSWKAILILYSHPLLGLASGPSPSDSPSNPFIHPFSHSQVLHALPISFFFA